jgi:hypothetical protein
MTAAELWILFEPVLLDDIARLRARTRRVTTDDVRTIFNPVLMAIAKAAGGLTVQRTLVRSRLVDWEPEKVSEASLRTFVSRLVEAGAPPAPTVDFDALRRRSRELLLECAI